MSIYRHYQNTHLNAKVYLKLVFADVLVVGHLHEDCCKIVRLTRDYF